MTNSWSLHPVWMHTVLITQSFIEITPAPHYHEFGEFYILYKEYMALLLPGWTNSCMYLLTNVTSLMLSNFWWMRKSFYSGCLWLQSSQVAYSPLWWLEWEWPLWFMCVNAESPGGWNILENIIEIWSYWRRYITRCEFWDFKTSSHPQLVLSASLSLPFSCLNT